jgi:hypothetical protein
MMTGDAGFGFNGQNVFGWDALGGLEPFPDGGLTNAASAGQSGLAASAVNGGAEGFEGGWCHVHK